MTKFLLFFLIFELISYSVPVYPDDSEQVNIKNSYKDSSTQKTKHRIDVPNGKFTFSINSIKGLLKLNSNEPEFLVAEGRSGDTIKISQAKYPSISIDLHKVPYNHVELKLIKNKQIVYNKNISENYIVINDFAKNNKYLLKIFDNNGAIKISQRFSISK